MLIRDLRPIFAALVALTAASPAYAEKLKCKVQLDQSLDGDAGDDAAARIVLEIDHDNRKAQIKVGTLGSPMKPKFKNVTVTDQDDYIVFDATPENALDSEKAGCSTRQYFYNLRLSRNEMRGELVVTPSYKRGSSANCKGFAAPEIIADHYRNVLCLVSNN